MPRPGRARRASLTSGHLTGKPAYDDAIEGPGAAPGSSS